MAEGAVLDFPQSSRLVIIGMPGTGKSSLARMIFDAYQGDKIVIDPADSELTDDPTYQTTNTLDFNFSKIHTWRWVPTEAEIDRGLDVYNDLYLHIFRQKIPLLGWTDEGSEVSTANRTPTGVRSELKLGRKIPHTHIMTTQRPAEVSTSFWSTASHWAIFHIEYSKDQETVAQNLGINRPELVEMMNQLSFHGFIWKRVGVGEDPLLVTNGVKLPEHIAAKKGIVKR